MPVSIEHRADIAVVWIDHPPVNVLSQAVRAGLLDAAERLDADPTVRAVVLGCRGRTFIAGADVSEFGQAPKPPHLPDVIRRLERAAKPWVAALFGTSLGGGFEVALGCQGRVAAPDTNMGLPEVTLGVIPGAGGTVMVSERVDADTAVELVTGGRPLEAGRAAAVGLVDVVADGDLIDAAIAHARTLADRTATTGPERPAAPDASYWDTAEARVRQQAKGQRAPLEALAAVRDAYALDRTTALARERERFLALRASPQAAALRHVFFAERAVAKVPAIAGVTPRPLTSTAVIGGGTMGAGIATALLATGLPVILVERDADALAAGRTRIDGLLHAAERRGKLSAAARAEQRARLGGTTDYADLGGTDLVIEAVFEDLDVKRRVFTALDQHCRAGAILATNTSYLDPNAIAAATQRPGDVLGLHFFSPAHIVKLLEIVAADATTPDVLATGFALAKRLGKVGVLAGVCDGFIGNRILKRYRSAAERLLLAGASVQEIDQAMRGFGLPMGPFEAQDMGGLDIAAAQRTAARRQAGITVRPWQADSIVAAILHPMIAEGITILADGIAARPLDIDLVQIHGYGFPRWRGGPMHTADAIGLDTVLTTLEADPNTTPPALLRQLVADGTPLSSLNAKS